MRVQSISTVVRATISTHNRIAVGLITGSDKAGCLPAPAFQEIF
jgi:hypothetical protein